MESVSEIAKSLHLRPRIAFVAASRRRKNRS